MFPYPPPNELVAPYGEYCVVGTTEDSDVGLAGISGAAVVDVGDEVEAELAGTEV